VLFVRVTTHVFAFSGSCQMIRVWQSSMKKWLSTMGAEIPIRPYVPSYAAILAPSIWASNPNWSVSLMIVPSVLSVILTYLRSVSMYQ